MIIPATIFQAVQDKLEANRIKWGKPSSGEYLLAKHCVCGECGYRLYTIKKTANKAKNVYVYYHCPSDNYDAARECSQTNFRQDKVDAAVWAWVSDILTDETKDEDGLTKLERALQSQAAKLDQQRQPIQRQYEAAQEQQKQLSAELDNTLPILKTLKRGSRAYAAVVDDINRLENALNKVEATARQLKEKLDNNLSPDKIKRVQEYARFIAEGMKDAKDNFELRRNTIDGLDLEVKLQKVVRQVFALG